MTTDKEAKVGWVYRSFRIEPVLGWFAIRQINDRILMASSAAKPLPSRDELGDLDQAQWEDGPGGEPRDPWQETRFLYLVDQGTAEAFTFSTSSWSGRDAVVALANQIALMRRARPNVVPIVALGSAPQQTKYGRKWKPTFKVVRWHGGDVELARTFAGEPPPASEDDFR